jgi:ATP-binding protein involved in chromosome partitioning
MPESGAAAAAAGTRGPALDGVKRIVAVSSAKGGVGKSTVAANLAVALAQSGQRVGLADMDIYGPSAPILFGTTTLPEADQETRLIRPVAAHGVQLMSMGFFLDDDAPVVWRGPMVMSATKQFLRGVAWDALDILVVDLPPGTGDIVLTLVQEVPLDGALVVTTPQDVALADVRRGMAMFAKTNTPVLGIVENMAGFVCPGCGKRDDLFGSRGGRALEQDLGAPCLAEIPIWTEIRASGDGGEPLVASQPDHPAAALYRDLATAVGVAVDTVRGDLHGPEPVEIVHDQAGGRLRIRWSDGKDTDYALEGLRGWCPCAQCQGHSGQISFVAGADATLTGFEGVGRYAVRFLWGDGHATGMYSYAWLREIADFQECA